MSPGVVSGVGVQCQPKLPQVVQALGRAGRIPHGQKSGKEQRHQDADDRNHDQQLRERKTGATHGVASFVSPRQEVRSVFRSASPARRHASELTRNEKKGGAPRTAPPSGVSHLERDGG